MPQRCGFGTGYYVSFGLFEEQTCTLYSSWELQCNRPFSCCASSVLSKKITDIEKRPNKIHTANAPTNNMTWERPENGRPFW